MGENKTKSYTIDAVNRYNAKFDRIMASFPTGTKERIKQVTGQSANKYITAVVLADLERLERSQQGNQEQETVAADQQKTETEQEYLTPLQQAQMRVTLAREKAKAEQSE